MENYWKQKTIQIRIDGQIIYVDTADFSELRIARKDNEFKVIKSLVSETPPFLIQLGSNQSDSIDFPESPEPDKDNL